MDPSFLSLPDRSEDYTHIFGAAASDILSLKHANTHIQIKQKKNLSDGLV